VNEKERKNKLQYIHWLLKTAKRSSIEQSDVDREGGKIYGFRRCCVDNYVRLVAEGKMAGAYMDFIFGEDDMSDISDNPHVRCVRCRKTKGW